MIIPKSRCPPKAATRHGIHVPILIELANRSDWSSIELARSSVPSGSWWQGCKISELLLSIQSGDPSAPGLMVEMFTNLLPGNRVLSLLVTVYAG